VGDAQGATDTGFRGFTWTPWASSYAPPYRVHGVFGVSADPFEPLAEWSCCPQVAQLAKLEAYQRRHGHCNVPAGWAEDPELAYWVQRQRVSIAVGEPVITCASPPSARKDTYDQSCYCARSG
jgi:hypothetical protein